ncbi:MAG TPA: endo-1,4-beta-xylanase, partial [Phycisphaerae bacterium]|nr:endo-1,4-beta-xylanase [Phycisphaerae bacterium]
MPLSDENIEERIHRHRTAEVTLAVRDARGRPLAGKAVTVRQVRHKFLFGSNAFGMYKCRTPADSAAYRRCFAGLLNFATLPFYWGGYEPTEGAPEADRLAAMARWCAAKGIRSKGHPLCWHEVCPAWLQGRPVAEVESVQLARIARDVRGFAGRIDTWDVLNEAVIMPAAHWGPNPISRLCRARGRVGLLRRCFDRARKANPGATLILNDFDVTPDCERLLGRCIEAGVKFDVIGIQSHM